MGVTANYAFPYPSLSDAPNGPAQIQSLATAVDAALKTVNNTVDALGLSWTTYTPTFTTAGGGGSVGNGTLSGAYVRIGRTVTVRVNFKAGSTTNFGSQAFQFALPFTAATVSGFAGLPIWTGTAYALDTTVSNWLGVVRIESGATFLTITGYNTGAQFGVFDAGATQIPFIWSNGDYLQAQITYLSAT